MLETVVEAVFNALALGWIGVGLASVFTSLRSGKAKAQWAFIMLMLPPVGIGAYLHKNWGRTDRRYLPLLLGLTVLVAIATLIQLSCLFA